MTFNGRRRLRLFLKLGLLVSLPLAGYLWAVSGLSPLTIGLSAVCAVLALGAEGLASASETRLLELKALSDEEDRKFTAEMAIHDEKIRQMDHVVETLSNQNHDLRGKLVSLHGEVHRLNEESEQLVGRDALVEDATPAEKQVEEQVSGEITDITSLIKR